uniref:Copper transport protein n=1 Tax=Macrostomum lignano TaxID=282301 RepID=A0A1I8GRC7_9PLAT
MSHDHAKMMMGGGADSDSAMPGMSMPSKNGSFGGHMMMMYFHTMLSDYVLFKPFLVISAGGMVGACLVIFVLAALYEGLKVLREHLLIANAVGRRAGRNGAGASFVPDGTQPETYVPKGRDLAMLSGAHALQTGLHALQISLSYALMLVFMTYSVWLCLAVILGSTLGYFLFGWLRRTTIDISEHCH